MTALPFRGQKYDKADEVKDTEILSETTGEDERIVSKSNEENNAAVVFARTEEWLWAGK